MSEASGSGRFKTMYDNGNYCYLERENYKDLKIRLSKISYSDINAAFFSAPPSNKRCTLKVH